MGLATHPKSEVYSFAIIYVGTDQKQGITMSHKIAHWLIDIHPNIGWYMLV